MSEPSSMMDVYQLHVWLCEIAPLIWRRLLVRSDSTIADLHHRPSENEAVTSGKVATNRMKKHSVVISAVLGLFTDLGPSELLEKPL
jgi:hypothetical protein